MELPPYRLAYYGTAVHCNLLRADTFFRRLGYVICTDALPKLDTDIYVLRMISRIGHHVANSMPLPV